MGITILESILSVFFIALIVTVLFRQLRLPVILGYLLVGALVGPHAFGLIPESDNINALAEFGIVFLMFTVGLEFSLPKLFSLKKPVFMIGGLQVLLSIVITTLIGKCIGMSPMSALVVGGIVAMSSTAIVVKQLHDQLELQSPHSLNAIGILLFQDLAVIPFIILIAGLTQNGNVNLAKIFLWAIFKGAFAIFLIFIIGRWLLRPLFRMIAKTHAIELFTLCVLLVTLTAAWLTQMLGLSYALGAFLAGIMLAETEFRHQIEVEIRPFRDILLGLFFISIGMLTDISSWHQTWHWILLLLIALIVGKLLLITLLSRVTGNNLTTSLRTGLVLAEGGEFGFAILTLALTQHIIPVDYGQVILAALLLSLVISPILIYYNEKIADLLLPKQKEFIESGLQKEIREAAKNLNNHIILCGYGRVGQHIARLLDQIKFPYIALDLDAELVERASLAGDNVLYGDATHPAILNTVGIDHAKVLVISSSYLHVTIKILSMVRQSHPSLPILVRCRDEKELRELKKYGATQIIAELFEESLTLSHHLMNIIKMPANKISAILQEVRNKDYDLLQKVFTGKFEESDPREELNNKELRPILISKQAYAVNHTLTQLNLRSREIEVVAIRRGKLKQIKPRGDTCLRANDILILFGNTQDLEDAEGFLLEGR